MSIITIREDFCTLQSYPQTSTLTKREDWHYGQVSYPNQKGEKNILKNIFYFLS
jgi:hypothetical protein